MVLFNYCPICGQRVEPVSRMIEPRPTYASTVRDLVGEKLIYANMADDGLIHRWTPDYTNRNDDPVRNRGICLNECFSLRIRDVKIEDERNWLSCYFANEMTILLREYGKENVTIEWGILGYCE
ncbi:MAG TPA: hypothetical protein VNU68_07160 [Verrucomicrobiae bacterium]|nr:hypothetical protein [Verrucomicrobiae bacterium]